MKLDALKDKKEIDVIFSKNAFGIYNANIKLRGIRSKDTKILISVPNRLLKKAVDRNYIKRVIREIVRKKEIAGYNVAFIYNKNTVLSYKEIEESILFLISKLK